MERWLNGYERIVIPGTTEQPYRGIPYKVVIHKMQGWLVGSLASYRQNLGVPHFSIEYRDGKGNLTRRKVQHFPLDKMSRALLNAPGGVETNADGAIQVEISGFSENAADIPDDELAFYAEFLVDLKRAGVPFELKAPPFKGVNEAYGFESSTRFSGAEWDDYDGVCGHQHVPENDHWDPGALNITRVLELANRALGLVGPTTVQEDSLSAAEVLQIVGHIEEAEAVTRADARNAITAAVQGIVGWAQEAHDVTRQYLAGLIQAASPTLTDDQIAQIAAAIPTPDPKAVVVELRETLERGAA